MKTVVLRLEIDVPEFLVSELSNSLKLSAYQLLVSISRRYEGAELGLRRFIDVEDVTDKCFSTVKRYTVVMNDEPAGEFDSLNGAKRLAKQLRSASHKVVIKYPR